MIISQFSCICREIFCIEGIIFREIFVEITEREKGRSSAERAGRNQNPVLPQGKNGASGRDKKGKRGQKFWPFQPQSLTGW